MRGRQQVQCLILCSYSLRYMYIESNQFSMSHSQWALIDFNNNEIQRVCNEMSNSCLNMKNHSLYINKFEYIVIIAYHQCGKDTIYWGIHYIQFEQTNIPQNNIIL